MLTKWSYITTRLLLQAGRGDKEVVSSAAIDYLHFSGYVMLSHQWLRMTVVAEKKLATGGRSPKDFYEAKLATSDFFFENLLPRSRAYSKSILTGSKTTMAVKEEWF